VRRIVDAGTQGRALAAGLALAVVLTACTSPVPPGGGTSTTTTTSPTSTSTSSTPTSTSTTGPNPSTSTTSASTTTTTEPPPRIDGTFSATIAGSFGSATYTSGDYRVSVTQSNQPDHQELQVNVMDHEDMTQLALVFATRKDSQELLEVGTYGDAQGWPFNGAGRPGLHVSSWGELELGFCSSQTGNFEVRDIRRDGPAITQAWITFQRYCDGDRPIWGEIRLGYPQASYGAVPQVVRWPGVYPGRTTSVTPVLVRPPSEAPLDVSGVSVVGPHAADFPIRENGCQGAVDAAGCVVSLGFTPHGPGPRHGDLQVTTSSGTVVVSLDGWGHVGVSEWVIDVDWEDPGRVDEHLQLPYSHTWGGPYEFNTNAWAEGGPELWHAFFDLAGNETFQPGQHYTWNADSTGLRVSLSRDNMGCEVDQATADVDDIAYAGPDDEIALLDLATDVHCRAGYGWTYHARVRFHDRDDQTAPGPVTAISAVRHGDQVTLAWANPPAADLAGVVVRAYPGDAAPGATDSGRAVHVGSGTTATFTVPDPRPIALSFWAYDRTGNVGEPHEVQVAA
jgi:hypothetical protein